MRAFVLLVSHFFGRFFDNDIVAQESDMRTNVVQALGFVAVPGMFAAFAMLPTGVRYDEPFAHGWEVITDYYFFVLYSMVVMGFVMAIYAGGRFGIPLVAVALALPVPATWQLARRYSERDLLILIFLAWALGMVFALVAFGFPDPQ